MNVKQQRARTLPYGAFNFYDGDGNTQKPDLRAN